MEPVRLEKTEVSGQIANMGYRFAGQGRDFTKGYMKRRVL
jgi:hypothetical protein